MKYYELFYKQQLPRLLIIICGQPAEVDAGWLIDGVPGNRIGTGDSLMV